MWDNVVCSFIPNIKTKWLKILFQILKIKEKSESKKDEIDLEKIENILYQVLCLFNDKYTWINSYQGLKEPLKFWEYQNII